MDKELEKMERQVNGLMKRIENVTHKLDEKMQSYFDYLTAGNFKATDYIVTIETLMSPDSKVESIAVMSRGLMAQAIIQAWNWKALPTIVLKKYADLCVEKVTDISSTTEREQ